MNIFSLSVASHGVKTMQFSAPCPMKSSFPEYKTFYTKNVLLCLTVVVKAILIWE